MVILDLQLFGGRGGGSGGSGGGGTGCPGPASRDVPAVVLDGQVEIIENIFQRSTGIPGGNGQRVGLTVKGTAADVGVGNLGDREGGSIARRTGRGGSRRTRGFRRADAWSALCGRRRTDCRNAGPIG